MSLAMIIDPMLCDIRDGNQVVLVAASVTTPIVLQHLANQRLKEEVPGLRQQTAETERLRKEGETLKATAQSSERERAREQAELARLVANWRRSKPVERKPTPSPVRRGLSAGRYVS